MRYGPASGGGPGLWATPSSATTFFLSFLTVRRHRAAIGNPTAGLPRHRCYPCPQKSPPRTPAAPSCIPPSPPSLTATSFLTNPLTPFPSLAGSWRAVQRTVPTPQSAALASPWAQSHACGRCSHLLFEQVSYVPLACCCTHVCTRESARRDGDACERAEVHSYVCAWSSLVQCSCVF